MPITHSPKNPSRSARYIANAMSSFEYGFPIANVCHNAQIFEREPFSVQVLIVQSPCQPQCLLARNLSSGRVLRILNDRAIADSKHIPEMSQHLAIRAFSIN